MFKLDLEFHKIEGLKKMIVAYRNGGPIKIDDIAEVEDGLDDYRQTARHNNKPSIGLGIIKVANSNTVDIINKIKEKIETQIKPSLPQVWSWGVN